ncbi:MAG: matrixin family metalloprotease [Gloeotrichia echinulata GP01]
MGSNKKVKLGLDSELTKALANETQLENYGDYDILLPQNINIPDESISSFDNLSDSLNGSPKLWNSNIDAKSLDKLQEPLNLFPETIPDAIYAPGATMTEPEPFVTTGYKWSQPGGKNTPVTITYSYTNLLNGNLPGGLTNSQITGIITEAVGLWSRYAPLNFVEVPDSGPAPSDSSYSAGSYPQIRFGVHYIDGTDSVLAHGYYPYSTTDGLAGDIHFDSGETWKASPSAGGFDLLEVAVHELGHALGLNHESTQTAIMNPYYGSRYSGLGSAFLFQDDINGIQDIYGTRYLLTMQRWATRQGGFSDAQQWLSGDFNGDGKDDVAKAFNDGGLGSIDVHVSNGSSFTMQRWATRQGGFSDAQQWLSGDFNGDGKDDVAKAFNDGGLGSIDVHVSNGSSFTMQRWGFLRT